MKIHTFHLLRFCLLLLGSCFSATKLSAQHQIFADEISSPNVTCFAEDAQGVIWIGTNRGLNKFNGSSYVTYFAGSDSHTLNNDNINQMTFDQSGNLWLTNECGLCVKTGEDFRSYGNTGFDKTYQVEELDASSVLVSDRYGLSKIDKKTLKTLLKLKDSRYSLLCNFAINRKGKEILFAPQKKKTEVLTLTDFNFKQYQDIQLPAPQIIKFLAMDQQDHLWIACEGGILYCLQTSTHTFLQVPQKLTSFCQGGNVLFLNCSADGTFYLGIQGKGILTFQAGKEPVQIFPEQKLLERQYVGFMDSRHNIWLGTQNGFMYYSAQNMYSTLTAMQTTMMDPTIKDLQIDTFGHLWVRSSQELLCCNKSSGTPLQYYPGTMGAIYIDSKGNLWTIENYFHVCCYSLNAQGERHLIHRYDFDSNVYSVSEDAEGNIWLAMMARFACIEKSGTISYQYPPSGLSFSRAQTEKKTRSMFLYTLNNGIYEYGAHKQFTQLASAVKNANCIYKSADNSYWIGSYNMGLSYYDAKTKKLKSYSKPSEGIFDPTIKSLNQDAQGYLWGANSAHIFRFDPQKETFYYINDSHFGKGNLYTQNCTTQDSEGNLYFGGNGGITVIHSKQIQTFHEKIQISMDAILINGQISDLNKDNNYKLDYTQNMLSIWFAGVSYDYGSALQYSYKLEGHDKDWIVSYTSKRAFYSELPDGNYRFLVRVRYRGDEWSEPQELCHIRIQPAPWNTWWARCFYLLALTALAFYAIRFIIRYRTRLERLKLAQRSEALRQNQVNFLTNISHEYRTPLSLIYGPITQLLHSKHLDAEETALLRLMKRNADHIKQLTEQILSVNSLEETWQANEDLKVSSVNLNEELQQITDNFRFMALENQVQVEFLEAENSPAETWIDTEKLKIILSNLMSNSIKYAKPEDAQEQALIQVSLSYQNDRAIIRVKDNGPGIPQEKADEIFQRYSRFSSNQEIEGSGIGLNYTLHLTSLHKGTIQYLPAQPHGSIFQLELPILAENYAPEERQENTEVADSKVSTSSEQSSTEGTDKKFTLLVAEDNLEVRHYLKQFLSKEYRVITAHDGQEALELIQVQMPDLVVSDIVMPRKDGFSLCSELKQSDQWGHLPVILLTAKTDVGNQIRGLDCGADSYVSKPFDPAYLQAVISNLLTNRERLQRLVLGLTSNSQKEETEQVKSSLSEGDRKLLEQIYQQMDAHLTEESFSAKTLAEQVNMSYSTLYARIKALTGQTPQNYIIAYRMNRAMELLKQHDKAVTEIAYEVGFSSVQYFSRSFKKHFGLNPTEIE